MLLPDIYKKLLAIILGCLLVFYTFGYIIVHTYRIFEVKTKVWESIEKSTYNNHLTILVFSKDDLSAGTPGFKRIDEKEFRYNGRMYDIVKEEMKNDSVYFYCIFDEKENLLISAFTLLIEKKHETDSSGRIASAAVFNFLADNNFTIQKIPQPEVCKTRLSFLSDNLFLNFFPDIPTPPPQLYFCS